MDTKALRQKILDLAIRGKLVPQDPNDEPASVLLERIRAEKQQMVKDGKLKPKDIKNDTVIFKGDDNLHYEQFADGTVKCIEDEIPFELPDGWEWCRLKDLFDIGSSKRVLQSDWKESGVPFYRAREIVKLSDNGYVDNELFISEEHYKKLSNEYGVPKAGDLMVSGVGTIGKTYVVKENDKFYYKDASVLCFSKKYDYLSSKFYRFVLESNFLRQQMNEGSKGTTVDTITISTASNYLVVLPPIKEQNKITNMVIQYLEFVDSIHDSKEQLSLLIRNTKFKILDLAIQGKLVPQDPNDEPASVLLERIRAEKEELIKQGKIKRDKKESVIFKGDDNSYYEKIGNDIICIDEELPFDIPHNWSWCRLGNIGDWAAGSTPSRSYPEYYNGTIPWLKTGDLNDGYITNIPESISEEALKNTSVRLNPSGSVLIAMYGATIGKLGILTFPATTNQACCACSPLDGINNHYLFYYLLSQKDNFVYRSVGGAQPNISKEKIVTTLMPVPPYEEQRQILDKIDIFFDLIRDIEKSLN